MVTHPDPALLESFMLAAQTGDLKSIQNLVLSGQIDVSIRDLKEFTSYFKTGEEKTFFYRNKSALHYACEHGHFDVVKFLIKHHARLDDLTFALKQTPLSIAAESGYWDIVEYLIKQGAKPFLRQKKYMDASICEAVMQNQYRMAEFLLCWGADINAFSFFKSSPIHCIDFKQDAQAMIALLLKWGANLHHMKPHSTSQAELLQRIVSLGELDLLHFVEDRGASFFVKDQNANNLTHIAAGSGKLDALQFLIRKGVDFRAKNNDQETALHKAISWGHQDVVHYLLDLGLSLERGICDRSVLEIAAGSGNLALFKDLLDLELQDQMKDKDDLFTSEVLRASIDGINYQGQNDIIRFVLTSRSWTVIELEDHIHRIMEKSHNAETVTLLKEAAEIEKIKIEQCELLEVTSLVRRANFSEQTTNEGRKRL